MLRRGMYMKLLPLLGLAMINLLCGVTEVDGAVTLQPPVKIHWHYYRLNTTCPKAEYIIKDATKELWEKDTSITPKLLKLVYADCLVRGCDASILLDGPKSEKTAPQNKWLGGFEVIDKLKAVVEKDCPGVVSCADLLNLAARDVAHYAGAPSYPVFTGRRDGMTSSAASVDLPSPDISWEAALAYFESKRLDVLDLVTLLGAHSTGEAHCSSVRNRLYNFNNTGKPDPKMNKDFAAKMRGLCTRKSRNDSSPIVLDQESSSKYKFASSYYHAILDHKGVLEVDDQMLYGNNTLAMTEEFAARFEDLRRSFALSMGRMGNINVLTGKQGEIRRHCRYTNKDNPYKN